ncbi:MAG TPA: fumarylacetoacetate hydrolase family protein [Intrasporangium sp.]|uniref:fumarylacetoacetate hydrolase family protein n=1 Tax=Intrasporangium sp. TaxID=1925024 RepID=UPI002B47B284|nr:fumarylacetoacetate hydrolase family protein [Intrasporangium sp.]HKX67235.1 fumarylacetoacetate hydrolase family protein [Intrasporangium sp.]
MRIARYTTGDDPAYGIVQGDPGQEVITPLKGDPLYVGLQPSGAGPVLLEDVRLLAPVIPRSKVVAVGRNYADHVKEMGGEAPPEQPMLFFKPNTAVVGPFDPVVLPSGSAEVSYEGELAVVIKTITKGVAAEKAAECIYGYTIANDVTARDWQRTDGQWARAKGFDTSCPLGPWIETELDPGDLRITTTLDGAVKQDGTTADMVHGVASIIEYASAAFTLLPGDVILTGTPAGVGLVEPGQQVTVDIDGIGSLTNTFVRR